MHHSASLEMCCFGQWEFGHAQTKHRRRLLFGSSFGFDFALIGCNAVQGWGLGRYVNGTSTHHLLHGDT